MLRKRSEKLMLVAVAAAILVTAALGGWAGAALAQGTAPAGSVRILGPLYPAFTATADHPLIDIGIAGMTNDPDWIRNNPLRDTITTSHKIPSGAIDWSGRPAGDGSGLTRVASDASLDGDGTAGAPLGVSNPFSAADATKLAGIEENSTRDQTPAELVASLTTLTGNSRLPATAIRDLPSGDGGLASVSTDVTLTGDGTVAVRSASPRLSPRRNGRISPRWTRWRPRRTTGSSLASTPAVTSSSGRELRPVAPLP